MTATATKKRSRREEEAEAQAQGLKAFDSVEAAPPDAPPMMVDDTKAMGDSTPGEGVLEPAPAKCRYCRRELLAEESGPACEKCNQVIDLSFAEGSKAKAFDDIAALNAEVSEAFSEWKVADEKAKGKKKAYEAMVTELRGLIFKMANPEPMPLFDGKTATAGGEVNPSDEAWKSVPLREALPELTDSVFTKLEGAQLFTMGELANYTAEDGGRRRLSDIAGIGPGVAGKIEEATMAFWSRYKPAAVPAPEDAARAAYLASPILWAEFSEAPADVSKLRTIGDLETHAAGLGMSIFDTLKNLGLGSVAADDVVRWLDEVRDGVRGDAEAE